MLTKELERAGFPTTQITALPPVARMVGSNRIIRASSVVHPVGEPDLEPTEEKAYRRKIVEEALKLLQKAESQE